ncbi:Mor transcription activator family protein [Denitratisoma sp. agr-D3]
MKLSTAHLPPQALELVDLIGLAATLVLVECYPGRVLDIPTGDRRRGREFLAELADKIGTEAAEKLSQRYGASPLVVPKCAAALRACRDGKVQQRFDVLTAGGLSARKAVAQLTGEFCLVERTIWRILKRCPGDVMSNPQQPDLFPV